MPPIRRERVFPASGLYVHSSPPRAAEAYVRRLVRAGDFARLERLVLDGQGKRLIYESPKDAKVREFLRGTVPDIMEKMKRAHEAASTGALAELRSMLDGPGARLALSRDQAGLGLLHRAVAGDIPDVVSYLLERFPQTVAMKDQEGRTPLHYVALCRDQKEMRKMLIAAGADAQQQDNRGHTARYYQDHPNEMDLPAMSDRFIRGPPLDGMVIKPSNIRIWIHHKDLANLQKVVWEGHGAKLRTETSNSPRVKKFLEAVPYLMGLIREVHQAVVNNDFGTLQEKTAEPVPDIIFLSKDVRGLTTLHKACGLGHMNIAKFIIGKCPKTLHMQDNEGRTPLHYSILLRDGNEMFDFLLENGAEESTLDSRQKTAAYYRTRTSDLDAKCLKTIPEAPRTATNGPPPSWDWNFLTGAGKTMTQSTDSIAEPSEVEDSHQEAQQVDGDDEPKTEAEEMAIDHQPEPQQQQHHLEDLFEELKPSEALAELDASLEHHLNEMATEPLAEAKAIAEDVMAEKPEVKKAIEGAKNGEQPQVYALEDDHNQTPDSLNEGVIEGVVNGENEVEQPNNDQNDVEVSRLIKEGSMEQLAGLVLDGEGDRLVGRRSDDPEIQAFLDNVPVYMSKIQRVHQAARDGSLKDLQASLDRRKFAIARDKASTDGATPLHIATVFGHTIIVRYLAGRFPETVHMQDRNGRTPLHYAAVIKDNGHYYNMLIHLGAIATTEDNFGKTAEYYRMVQTDFSHKMILKRFGADERLVEEMLQDKGPLLATPVDIPLFRTEEGRYLATSLGDPLIKGLTEIANKRPADPVTYLANYLYSFANNNHRKNIKKQESSSSMRTVTAGRDSNASQDHDQSLPTSPSESDVPDSSFSRDEHGQSVLHLAAARSHGRGALLQLLKESHVSLAYRDELYRTARDVSLQAGLPDNTQQIDQYIIFLATTGEREELKDLLIAGYDHLTDVMDENGTSIVEVAENHGQSSIATLLKTVPEFEERRERLFHAVRRGDMRDTRSLLEATGFSNGLEGKTLALTRDMRSRSLIHVAVLCQQEEIVDYLANSFPETLKLGDNLERTALHYAMGVENVEPISKLLIRAGAKRVMKDLKGRQASYYFMNKSDILGLQEEELEFE